MKNILWYGAAFLLLEIPVLILLHQDFTEKRERYFSKKIETVQITYDAILDTYGQIVQILYDQVIHQQSVLEILQEANSANPARRRELKNALFQEVFPAYVHVKDRADFSRDLNIGFTEMLAEEHVIKGQNINLFHFHLSDGTFLLSIEDSSMTDEQIGRKHAVELTNSLHVVVHGFEVEHAHIGFRYAFPLFSQHQHIGTAEIGISINSMLEQMKKLFRREAVLIFKKASIGAQAETSPYAENPLSDKYLYDDTNVFVHESKATIDALAHHIHDKIQQKLAKESSFVMPARRGQENFLVTFLPISNIQRQHVAYIVLYENDATVQNYLKDFYFKAFGTSLFVILLMAVTRRTLELRNANRTLKSLYDMIEHANETLEIRVQERTAELAAANVRLRSEIIDRERAESALVEERNLLRTLIDVLPDQIYVKDIQSRYVLMNTTSMLGLGASTIDELVGKTDFDLLPHTMAEQFYTAEQAMLHTGKMVINREVASVDSTNKAIWLLTTQVPFRDGQGKIAGFVGINRDITERKQWEEELKQHQDRLEELVKERTAKLSQANEHLRQEIAERKRAEEDAREAKETAEAANRAKSEFLTNISHELRTPLNGILGYTQILQQDNTLSSHQRKSISTIHQSGEHLLTLINDLLDLAKIEARKMTLEPGVFYFKEFLESLVYMAKIRAEYKGLSFTYQARTDLPGQLYGDETRLRQILLNLLGNAVKYTETGGIFFNVSSFPCQTTPEHLPEPLIPPNPNRYITLRFEVEDTGVGIPAAYLEHIFLPFQQVEENKNVCHEGTGLGLTISQQLTHLMGGSLQVKSAVKHGSTFCFQVSLPEVRALPEIKTPSHARLIGLAGTPQKALLVDDNVENRSVLHTMLRPLGFDIIEAADGEEAVTKARACHPDIILMDLVMPHVNGIDATRALRRISEFKDVTIVLVSASVFGKVQQDCLEAGADAFLAKPVHQEELFSLLQKHLDVEWRYEENEESYISEKTPQFKGTPLTYPPDDDIETLSNLAMIGDITNLKKQLHAIEAKEPIYAPFVKKIRWLVEELDLDRIYQVLSTQEA